MTTYHCPICNEPDPEVFLGGEKYSVTCKRCGKYIITDSFVEELESMNYFNDKLFLLSGHTKNSSKKPLLNTYNYEKIISSLSDLQVNDQIEHLLIYLSTHQTSPGEFILVSTKYDFPIAYCKNEKDFVFILETAYKLQYIETAPIYEGMGSHIVSSGRTEMRLAHSGYKELDKISESNKQSKQCFIAMSFDKKHEEIYEKGIKKVFELKEFNSLKAYRVDEDKSNNDKICNKIVSEIKKSRFIIADLTGNKHNVYYEIGYAMGHNIPIILTCRKKEFNKDEVKFDIRQYPIILYENEDYSDLIDELKETINARIL